MRTVSCSYLKCYFDVCVAQGATVEELIPYIPGGVAALQIPTSRFPVESVLNIMTTTERLTGNRAIGLEAGRNFRPEVFEEVGQALMFSKTLRHGSAMLHRYQPLFQQFGRSYIQTVDGAAWNFWDTYVDDPELYRHVTETTMVSHAQFGRWLSWQHEMPLQFVHFRHKKPSYHAQYDEIFKCPVLFGQDRNVIAADIALIDAPLPQANQNMLDEVCERLDQAMKDLQAPKTYAERTAVSTEDLLKTGTPDLSKTAADLGVSVRSLRRHLSQEGTSYRQVLEDTRRRLCERYLLEQRLALSEIAEKLGYSEQSAFNRAFKNWFGSSPKAYAKAMQVFNTAFDQMAP
jgi:AraC-like DNA-binding protein